MASAVTPRVDEVICLRRMTPVLLLLNHKGQQAADASNAPRVSRHSGRIQITTSLLLRWTLRLDGTNYGRRRTSQATRSTWYILLPNTDKFSVKKALPVPLAA